MAARNTKNRPGSKGGNFKDLWTFVDIRLNKSDKDAVSQWGKEQADDMLDLLSSILEGGHKLSVTWSDNTDCFIASFTGTDDECVNYGLVMSSRANNPWEAVVIGLYKHFEICDGGVWPKDTKQDDWG